MGLAQSGKKGVKELERVGRKKKKRKHLIQQQRQNAIARGQRLALLHRRRYLKNQKKVHQVKKLKKSQKGKGKRYVKRLR